VDCPLNRNKLSAISTIKEALTGRRIDRIEETVNTLILITDDGKSLILGDHIYLSWQEHIGDRFDGHPIYEKRSVTARFDNV
jgi:hypothetical protein